MRTYIDETTGGQWVEIEVAEGQFTVMLKSTYDEQQAQASQLGGN
jgi:hypothetical protein